jgi:hypothetical protein
MVYTTESFIKKAITTHGDKYNYSKVDYISLKYEVIITCYDHGDFLQAPSVHLRGISCSECKIKSNTNNFIKRSIKIHGNKYNYSKVIYNKATEKVNIICHKHKDFLQIASSHLRGNGCSKCGFENNKSNTNNFIKRSIKIHGNKYDYSKVNYIEAHNKVIIICNEHKDFLQEVNSHLRGAGCPICGGSNLLTNDIFIEKAIKIHGNKYDYSKVKYKNHMTNVIIICEKHKEFLQMPTKHLQNHGCPKCGGRIKSNTVDFIERAIKIHGNKYDYSKVDYIDSKSYVIIICEKHNEFLQTPNSHLQNHGCSRCTDQFSKPQIQWLELLMKLNNIYIQHALNDGEFKIPNVKYKVDGYCKETNTIYEFHGNYWHGNPKMFDSNSMNKTCNMTHGELYKKTLEKENIIKDLGYNLEVMWELDWTKINKSIRTIQKKFRLK